MLSGVPYWRLSGFYFFYFALLGTWLPYWALYLKSLNFNSAEIGLLSGLVMATKIIAPNVWGWLADRYSCRTRIIRVGAFLAAVAFSGVYLRQDFWWLGGVVVVYSFFWNAVLAQFDVLTLSHLAGRYARYSQIRVWGSIGFIGAVMGVGWWLDKHPIVHLLYMISLLLSAIWVASLLVGEKAETNSDKNHERGSLAKILRQPAVIGFFAVCFLLQVSHGPYYTFFSIFLEDKGYSKALTGGLWSLGVVAEVLLFLVMHRLMAKVSLRHIIIASLGLAALRWFLIGCYVDVLPVLVFAQCLHAASFGSFHAAGIEAVRYFFPGHHGQGMALYSGLSFGAGGASGALLSGWAWDISPLLCFAAAAFAAALAMAIAWRSLSTSALEAGRDEKPVV
jgi:PPP family 3-phenylpropionic acid transporter